MLIILGLVILLAAVIVGVAGVLGNDGATHALTDDFSVFGYHVTGSTGALFLYGIIVGAVAMFGLSMLLAGARRTSRRARLAQRELKRRDETTLPPEDVRPVAPVADGARAPVAEGTRAPVAEGTRAPVAEGTRTWRHPLGGHGTTVTH